MPKQNKTHFRTYTGKRRAANPFVITTLCLLFAALAGFYIFAVVFAKDEDTELQTVNTVSPAATPDISGVTQATAAPVKAVDIPNAEPTPTDTQPAVKVKGLYVTGWSAGIEERMEHLIGLCGTTEINTLVIDVKDDRGQITFRPVDEKLSGAGVNIIPNIEQTVSRLKGHGIYTIARVVCFKDPLWSGRNPDLAIHNKSGGVWKDNSGYSWLDPYNERSWEYIAAVSLEAARAGFDEVQLDYVRFPTDGKIKEIDYGSAAESKTKAEAIRDFLAYLRSVLKDVKIKLSADVFGIIIINKGDIEGIGQDFEMVAQNADYICPMIYPSHYASKRQNGKGQEINGKLFEAPDLEPYQVIYNTLMLVRKRMPEGAGHAVVRPYLQDFTASYLGSGYYQTYTAKQIEEQIQAVYDAGFEEWILWNASGKYSEDAFNTNLN